MIPDHILARYDELSFSEFVVYAYYLMRHRKGNQRQWAIKESEALSDLPAMPRRTYYEAKKELERKGWIEADRSLITPVEFPPKGASSRTPKSATHCTTEVQPTAPLSATDRTSKVQPIAPKSAAHCTTRNIEYSEPLEPTQNTQNPVGGVSPDSPEPDKNNGKNKQPDSEPTPDMIAVFDRWREVTDSKRAKFTDDRKKKIRARLESDRFTVEELFQCLEGWKLSPWHQGNNPSSTVYDKIETIFRNAEQVEKFIKLVSRPDVVWTDPEESDFKNPVKFADAMDLNFAVFCPDGDPRELFEKTKANYLARNKGEEFEAEVAAYEQNDEFRERLEKAGS